jgi:putative intracellular protease/amidase
VYRRGFGDPSTFWDVNHFGRLLDECGLQRPRHVLRGVSIFLRVRESREATAFDQKGAIFKLDAQGAKYESTGNWQPKFVVDGRLMTGQNPASAGPLAEAIVEALRKDSR